MDFSSANPLDILSVVDHETNKDKVIRLSGLAFNDLSLRGSYVPFGDSRVAAGSAYITDNPLIFPARGVFNHLEVLMGGRLSKAGYAGVSGDNSTLMLARVGNVIKYRPEWCFIMATVNDLIPANDFSLDLMKSNYVAIFNALRSAGIKIAISTISPWNLYTTLSQKTRHASFNRWLKSYCPNNGIYSIDTYKYVASPDTGGFAVAQSVYDANGHYSDYGAYMEAVAWKDVLDPVITKSHSINNNPFDCDNLVYNGVGGWAPGASLPSGWSYAGTLTTPGVATVVARPDGNPGSVINLVGTAAAQGQYMGIFSPVFNFATNRIGSNNYSALGTRAIFSDGNQYITTQAGVSGSSEPDLANVSVGQEVIDNACKWMRVENFVAGDTVVAEVEYFTKDISGGGLGCLPVFFCQSNGTPAELRVMVPADQSIKIPPAPGYGVLRTAPIRLLAGTTSYRFLIAAYLENGVTATLQIANASIRHTTLGVS